MEKCSYILFDKSPGRESPGFIEAEREGSSINCGDWEEQDDGLWRLYLNRLPELIEMEVEVERLREERLSLPRFADDVIAYPSTPGWFPSEKESGIVGETGWNCGNDEWGADIEDCYSTFEAAEAAKGGE